MDKDTLQIIIMVAGFAITIITFLLKFPSRDEMNKRFDNMNSRFDDMNSRFDDVNQRITDQNQQFNQRIADLNQQFNQRIADLNQRFDDMNQRLIDLSADVRNIYHVLIQGKLGESEKDD